MKNDQESNPKGDRRKKIITIRVELGNINNNNQKKNKFKKIIRNENTNNDNFRKKTVIQLNLCSDKINRACK